MPQRPTSLVLIAAGIPLAHCFFLLEARLLNFLVTGEWTPVTAAAPADFWLLLLSAIVLAPFVLRAQRWALALVPLFIGYMGLQTYGSEGVGGSLIAVTIYWGSVGFLSGVALVFDPRVLRVMLNPRLRWWLQSPRRRLPVAVEVASPHTGQGHLHTFDLSRTGAFIPSNGDLNFENDLETGDEISLRLILDGRPIKIRARVARVVAADGGSYPRGMGVEFLNLHASDLRRLQQHLTRAPHAEHRA